MRRRSIFPAAARRELRKTSPRTIASTLTIAVVPTAGASGEYEIEVAGNLCSNSIEAVRAAALTGQGICLLPLLSVAEDLKTGRLLRLLPDCVAADATIQAIYPGGRHLSTRVRTFLDFVAKRLREFDRIDPGKTHGELPVAREPAGTTTAPPKATSQAFSPTIAAPIASASRVSSSCALGVTRYGLQQARFERIGKDRQ